MTIVSRLRDTARVDNFFVEYLTDDQSNSNAVGDYETTPTSFTASPEGNTIWHISTFTLHMRSVHGQNIFQPQGYGVDDDPLTNGVEFRIRDVATGDVIVDFTDGRKIRRNMHWYHFSDSYEKSISESGQEFLNIKWHIKQETGRYIQLTSDEFIEVRLSDDINGKLLTQLFIIQGILED